MNIKLNHAVVLTIGIICSFSLQASQKIKAHLSKKHVEQVLSAIDILKNSGLPTTGLELSFQGSSGESFSTKITLEKPYKIPIACGLSFVAGCAVTWLTCKTKSHSSK